MHKKLTEFDFNKLLNSIRYLKMEQREQSFHSEMTSTDAVLNGCSPINAYKKNLQRCNQPHPKYDPFKLLNFSDHLPSFIIGFKPFVLHLSLSFNLDKTNYSY
jgi:hypothetical protein